MYDGSLTRLQEKLYQDFPTIFAQTKTHPDDFELWERWRGPLQDIENWCGTGKFSLIPGCFTIDFMGFEVENDEHECGTNGFGENYDEDKENYDEDDPETQWVDYFDQEVVTSVLSEAQVDSQTDKAQWHLDVETFDF